MRENLSKKEPLRRMNIFMCLLLICFFIVLFAGIAIIGVSSDSTEQIAYAKDSDPNEATASSPVVVGPNTNPTAASMNYPGGSSTTSFSTGNLSTSNTDFNGQSSWAIGYVASLTGSTDVPTINTTASAGIYYMQFPANNNRYQKGLTVINFSLNDIPILAKLYKNSNISTITCTVSFNFSSNECEEKGYSVGVAGTARCANDFKNNYTSWGTTNSSYSNTFTMKNSNTSSPYLYIGMRMQNNNTGLWDGYNSITSEVKITNIVIKFDVTRNNTYENAANTVIEDGAAPQVSSIDTTTTNVKTYPYRTSAGETSNANSWPMWYGTSTPTGTQVNRLLSRATDVCSVGSKIKLLSYTKESIFTWNGDALYKRVAFDVLDYYDYDGTGTSAAATYPAQASGIGSIQVGDVKSDSDGAIFSYASATGTMTNTAVQTSYSSSIARPVYVLYNETQYQRVGYAYIKRSASTYTGRQTATIVIYFSKNANISVSIKDFGGATVKQAIEVRGIDTTVANAPNVPANVISGDNNISATKNYVNMEWIYVSNPTFELNDNTDVDATATYDDGVAPNSPYIYYYEMQKLNGRNPSTAFSSYTKKTLAQLKNMVPFNVGYIDSFSFDFERGCTPNGVYPDGTITQNTTCTGNGYYHIIIYAVDLSGNYSNTTSVVEYYIKVDYEEAKYDIVMNYDFEGIPNTITYANNGTWATNQLELILSQRTVSYSGNTILFSDYDDKPHVIVIGSKSTTVAKKDLGCDVYSIDDVLVAQVPTATFGGQTWYQIVEDEIYFRANIIGLEQSEYEYKFLFCPTLSNVSTYLNFDYQTTFEIANGISFDDAEVVYVNDKWKDSSKELGVLIRIDRNKPMNPDFSDVDYTYFQDSLTYMPDDENTFDVQLGLKTSQGINNPRYWYTSGYTINSQVVFSDALADAFSKEVRVYIGYKNIAYVGNSYGNFVREEELTTNISQEIRTNLTSYRNEMNSIFGEGNWMVIDGGRFDDDPYSLNNYNLFQRDGIGLRVIYIWAVDQAGNMSEVSTKYILVDPTTYHVNSRYYQEDILKFGSNVGTVSIINSDERIISSFKRNDTIMLVSDLADGYVPYKLNKYVGSVAAPTVLGINNGSGTSMTLNDDIIMTYSSPTYTYIIPTDIESVFNYYNTNTTDNSNNDGIVFEIMFRKVLDVELNVLYGRYAGVDDLGNPLIALPYIIKDFEGNVLDSADEIAALSFTWYEDSSKTIPTGPLTRAQALTEYGTPVNADADAYFVVISTNSDYYIIREDVEKPFTINKANITITVKDNASVQYRRIESISWEDLLTVNGLCGVDITSYANIGLTLFGTSGVDWEIGLRNSNAQDVVVNNDIPVGVYTPYLKAQFALENYIVTFVTSQIQVTKYEISAIIYNANKTYGEDDPIFAFGILKEAFEDVSITPADVFISNAVDVSESGTYYIFTPKTQWIKRLAGENAGTYTFTTSISDFAVADSGNYTVSIDLTSEPTFTIAKRTITAIPNANQEALDTAGTVRYGFSSADAKYFTSEYVTGALGVSDVLYDTNVDGNYTLNRYAITIGTLTAVNTDNIQVVLDATPVYYIIKVYSGSNALVKVTQVSSFELTYGEVGTPTFVWNTTDYTTEALPAGYTITWTVDASGITNASTVGNYTLPVSNAQALDGDSNVDADYDVAIASIVVTIIPKEIVVTPNVTKANRVYGYLDTDATNGLEISYTASIDGIIDSGSLVRGVYNTLTGSLIAKGSRYDPASNELGNTTFNGAPAYYGLTIGNDFILNNQNYKVVFASTYETIRFVIEPRKMVLVSDADFYGVNKDYDGTTTVIYNAGDISVNITDKLARTSDAVSVSFEAVYDSAQIGNRTITFSALALTGDDAGNYVLYFGDASTQYVDQTVVITTLYPGAGAPQIQIVKAVAKIHISKSDIVISKQYDGTTTMRAADVSLGVSNPLNAYISAVVQSAYPASAVSNNYITDVTIVLDYEETIDSLGESNIIVDKGIEKTTGNGTVTLKITDMPVYITKRVITIDSFASAVGVDKCYDTTDLVDVAVTLKDGVLVSGDYVSDVGLKFTAHAAKLLKTNPGAGLFDRSVAYQGVPSYFKFVYNVMDAQNVNVFIDEATTSTASNYVCNITSDEWAEFCAKNEDTLKVTINKAELEPTLTIAARQYNGDVAINSSLVSESTTITSSISSKFIVKSAYDRTHIQLIYDELANISYEFANLHILLTKDGAKYPYVAFDENGLIVRHAVSFENFVITNVGGLTDDAVNVILSNYTLYGTFYTVSDEGTTAVVADKPQLALGTFIGADVYDSVAGGLGYESTITMLINKKNVVVRPVSVSVENKVYDGTTTGVAAINDPTTIGVVADDATHIDISLTAVYSQRDVGNEIRVDINNVKLTNKLGSEIDYVANYEVTNTAVYTNRAITPSYATINFDLAKKTYDGTNSIALSAIKPAISVPYERDRNNYSVNYSFGFLGGANVAVEGGDTSSDTATIYGVKLVSSRTEVNYNLYLKKAVDFDIFDNAGEFTAEYIAFVNENLRGVLDTSILALDGTIVDAAKYNSYVNLNDYAATKFYYNRTNDNRTAYVTLPVTTIKTFKYTDYVAGRVTIDDTSKIIGEYVSNTIRYVAAREDAILSTSGSGSYDEREYTEVPIEKQYDHFVGPADLTFKISSELNNFQKQYDGTKKINGAVMVGRTTERAGVEGLPYNSLTGKWGSYTISFDIPLDDAQKEKIVFLAEYKSASAGIQNIEFRILNDTEYPEYILDDPNYSSTNTTVTVVGEISRAVINAYLEDNTVPYGTMIKDRVDHVRYSTNASFSISKPLPLVNTFATDNIDLYVIDGVLGYFKDTNVNTSGVKYYTYNAVFTEATDFELGEDYHFYSKIAEEYHAVSSIDPGETYYICRSVEMVECEYDNAGTNYIFVPVQGSMNLPKVFTKVTNATPVGVGKAQLLGGDATNYKFELHHEHGDESNLEVTPLTVYVYAEDTYVEEEGSTVNYADHLSYSSTGTIPQFSLGFAQSTTSQLSGFVNGQTASELVRKGDLVMPITKVRLFDGTNPVGTDLTMADLSTVSEQLPAGQFYFIYIDLSGASATNYVLKRKNGEDFDATKVAKLLVEYPEITNYSVVNTTKTYNGQPINVDYIGEGGTVKYEYYNNSEMTGTPQDSVTNAGEYYAKVTVTKAGFKDWYGYATLKIKKAAFKITIPAIDVDYDGLTKSATVRLSAIAPSTSDISITYQKGSQVVGTPRDVGVYTVIAKYTADEDLTNFAGGSYAYNFMSASTNGALVIHGAVIDVIVSEEDKNTIIRNEGDTAEINYKLSVDEKYYEMLSNAGWDYEDLNAIVENGGILIKYYNAESFNVDDALDEITEMGVYNYVFEVGYGANIILNGDISGSFIVGTNKLDNENSKQRTIINSVGNTILNADTQLVYENVVYTTKINSGATSAQYNAIKANNTLYTQIESNVPSLAEKFYETATLKGILKVQMRMGDVNGESTLIQPNGKVKVTVIVPSSYELDEQTFIYKVTENGTLEKVDYTVNGKYVTYETDYVNTIVFVRVNTFMEWLTENWWLAAAAGAGVLVLLVIIIAPSAAAGAKKRKAKKLAAQTAGQTPDNPLAAEIEDAPMQDTSAPAPETSAPEAPPVEESPVAPPPPVEEPPIETPPVEEPPMVEEPPVETPPPVVEEPAPAPEAPAPEVPPVEEPAPAPETPAPEAPAPEAPTPAPEAPKKAPPPGAVGQKPSAAPKKAPPPGAVGQKAAAAPKKAPPPGAVGTKPTTAAPKKAPPPGAVGKK